VSIPPGLREKLIRAGKFKLKNSALILSSAVEQEGDSERIQSRRRIGLGFGFEARKQNHSGSPQMLFFL
jgi:hypothetical protein